MKLWDRKTHYRYAQLKLNGFYVKVGGMRTLTRTDTDYTDKLRCNEDVALARQLAREYGYEVHGELMAPEGTSGDVSHLLAVAPNTLKLYAFALFNESVAVAKMPLERVNMVLKHAGLRHPYTLRVEDNEPMPTIEQAKAIDPKAEGWVFKNANLIGWCKHKEEKTIDLLITGTVPGKGKYEGQIGALICSTVEGVEVCKCSGMTDEQRLELSQGFVGGLICEVSYQFVGNGGRLIHPRFKRLREDKPREECTLEQDPKLAEHWKQ